MSKTEQRLSGYNISRVYSTRQELQARNVEDVSEDGTIRFSWDWRWFVGQRTFEVKILIVVEPTKERPELIVSDVIGRFDQIDESPNISISEFTRLQAVAILLPYARQFLSNLTSNSLRGTFYLPTLNVNALMKDFENFKTTADQQTEANVKDDTRLPGAKDASKRPATRRTSSKLKK